MTDIVFSDQEDICSPAHTTRPVLLYAVEEQFEARSDPSDLRSGTRVAGVLRPKRRAPQRERPRCYAGNAGSS